MIERADDIPGYFSNSPLGFSIPDWKVCCGIREIGIFEFPTREESLEAIEVFKKELKDFAWEYEFCFYHLTLTYDEGEDPYQPYWFVEFIKGLPDVTISPKRLNPNSGNLVEMIVIPVDSL